MSRPERKPLRGYLWAAMAILTCPCHLPILVVALGGTTVGAFLGAHLGIAAFGLVSLFSLSVLQAWRFLRKKS
ncbi:hypothetical protein MAMC_02011 [Methylacidimicrobium cyclopophantes]|uniref:Uncharacterized protein n=1 Tax=Methylacidimicrobium cyclopophantes TaxID=1041766 RepID=A0A5E6MGQ0_9BACT|nr:broad-spectrum mercury transporter MerE [Methylacidimicrobium cyclopophantes]VVM08192.1 hypothetical protein MAMC_02011 [Methylacidimicrobium cyclopophantes]